MKPCPSCSRKNWHLAKFCTQCGRDIKDVEARGSWLTIAVALAVGAAVVLVLWVGR